MKLIYKSCDPEKLESLNLSRNCLDELPIPFFEVFGQLKVLNLSHNRIRRLNEEFGGLVNLRRLDISNNLLKRLPLSFANLEHLEWLNVGNNKLDTDLADIVGNCSNSVECSMAAKSALQYAHFSATLFEMSQLTSSQDISDDYYTEDTEFEEEGDSVLVRRRKKFRKQYNQPDQNPKDLKESPRSSGYSFVNVRNITLGIIFCGILFAGVAIWMIIDSIRMDCSMETSTLDGNAQLNRICSGLDIFVQNGSLPDSLRLFTKDFGSLFYQRLIELFNYQIFPRLHRILSILLIHLRLVFIMLYYSVKDLLLSAFDYTNYTLHYLFYVLY